MSERPATPVLDPGIRYVCVAEGHAADWAMRQNASLNPVTIHNGSWAFCPLDALGDGHIWEPVQTSEAADGRNGASS